LFWDGEGGRGVSAAVIFSFVSLALVLVVDWTGLDWTGLDDITSLSRTVWLTAGLAHFRKSRNDG